MPNNGRVSACHWSSQTLGKALGLYDARFTWPLWHVMVTGHVEMIESAGALMVTVVMVLKINTPIPNAVFAHHDLFQTTISQLLSKVLSWRV